MHGLHEDIITAGEAAAEGEGWSYIQLGGQHQGEDLQRQGGGGCCHQGEEEESCKKKHKNDRRKN